MTPELPIAPPRRRRARQVEHGQLALFDAAPAPARACADSKTKRDIRSRARGPAVSRMLTIEDMPDYPSELHEVVDRMLCDLSADRVLFTYRAIQHCFGISRATVARRVKDGLVPGVRMMCGRVLDDGPVRRFDRTQIRWLLLAVRYAKRRE